MSVSNLTKQAVFTPTNTSKNVATMYRYVKAGAGWNYDDPNITYDGATDPNTGLPVYYDSLGTQPTFTNLTKHAA